MKNKKLKTAFSLIELSIVILIIGVIVAGVTQSSRLISAFRLSTARNLTQSSPVASIKNLTAWWETTSVASFTDSQADNGQTVTTWYDINPQSTSKYNTTGGNGATYTNNCMNALPCLRFAGSPANYFNYDGSFLANSDYTIFAVEQRRSGTGSGGGTNNMVLGGTNAAENTNLQVGYFQNTSILFGQWNNDYIATVASYSTPIPRILTYRFSSASGKNLYVNGSSMTLNSLGGTPVATQGLVSYPGAMIGGYYQNNTTWLYFVGDICEIIIFTRAITVEERQAVERYLGKKWGITVS